MRCSEGIKRHSDETKKRIFDEIIAAAENGDTTDISHRDSSKAIITDISREDNKMNTNTNARIKSRKGGIIAAACAVLVVGGGIFAANHMSGKNGIDTAPGAMAGAGSSTDAEDTTLYGKAEEEASEDSTAEDEEEKTESQAEDRPVDLSDGEEYWRSEASEDAERLVDGSDLIADMQIVNILTENIDGKDYTAYYCSLIDEEGNSGMIYKYTGDEDISRVCILQERFEGQVDLLPKVGDKVFVMAKNEVQSTSGAYSLELTEDVTIFKWDNEVKTYQNYLKPGHAVGTDESGKVSDYEDGIYEHDVDDYYKSMLSLTTYDEARFDDWSVIENWCRFYDVPFRTVEESGTGGIPKGAISGIEWSTIYNTDFDGVTVFVSDGTDDENGKSIDKGTEGAVHLNIHDKGVTKEEFESYDLELGDLCYDEAGNSLIIVINVTKKDGTEFAADFDNNQIDLIYGDLEPMMKLTESELLSTGLTWVSEEDSHVLKYGCVLCGGTDLKNIDKTVPVTISVNTIKTPEKEETGLFEATFNIDVDDIM